jgi:hypothetical protein
MSLKQDLLDAGVNLSDMARDMPDENYPNLYEVLRKEERGMDIKSRAQVERLEKLRAYLAGVLDGTVTAVHAEEQEPEYDEAGKLVEVGDKWRIMQAQTRPVPEGKVLVRHNIRIKGKLCGPGVIVSLSQAHGPLEAGDYMFLRALAKADEPDIPVEIELYGGPGYLRAKKCDKTGYPKWFAKHRSVRPECFSKARPPVSRPTPDSDYTMEEYQDDMD